MIATDARRRTAGILLISGPSTLLLAEFISAAAWTDPPYSYTRNFISNLGVEGPSTLFGQYMASPLFWLMNAGFFAFGLVILAGIVALPGLSGARRWSVLLPATVLAIGGVLLGLFPGSGESMTDGTGDFHSMGAFAGFLGASVLAIFLGRMSQQVALSRGMGRALVVVGCVGIVSTVVYLTLLINGGETLGVIGLIERGATHPVLIGLLVAGTKLATPTK